ncbi:hypothetical protein [Clostridium sp. KNHs214]|uniref:hypothetical protein n=1 Tax=Clostridium sp. KNHs214 TaxID=1540257 RepID=UPI0005523F5A|nr:hypothetical protein [Clostridium sp. KNHs214]
MPEIRNIPGVYQVNTKRNREKLNFELGEKFLARIIDVGEEEILLKLLDGWKFPAKLKNPLDYMPNGLVKFEVDGFEDGKLILKLIQEQLSQHGDKDGIEEFLKNNNMNLNKEDYSLLREMIKHEIPLTKENITYMKNMDNLMNKIHSEEYMENFIYKYISSKGISVDSAEGNEIKDLLRGFFSSLEKLDLEDILILYENNIDISKENIDGFINVFKGSKDIFTLLKGLQEKGLQESVGTTENNDKEKLVGNNSKETVQIEVKSDNIEYKSQEKTASTENNIKNNTKNNMQNSTDNNTEKNTENNTQNDVENSTENSIRKSMGKNVEKNIENSGKNLEVSSENDSGNNKNNNINNEKGIESNIKNNIQKSGENKIKNVPENAAEDISLKDLHKEVKNQVELKTNEMKNIIKDLLDNIIKSDSKSYPKVMEMLKDNISNFKIFNSLSNEYYYLDLPINIRDNVYPCKLVIKDGREKGKVIDTKNVKIATSIKTMNMGVVDTFIRVDNSIMNVEIKCQRNWVKIVEKNKDKLLEMLSDSLYNIYIKVSEKEEEFNLSNCREFFGDSGLNKLNVKV